MVKIVKNQQKDAIWARKLPGGKNKRGCPFGTASKIKIVFG
jgi:hypothetical protein